MIFWSNPDGSPGFTQFCAKHHPGFNLHCFVPATPTTKMKREESAAWRRSTAGGPSSW
jgi:hypothetical protein